ncbi:MAG: trigger factor [Lachnospiraceae bacterium]|nr:trigger factor [Lachnospiraceae bacterium]
MKKKAVVYLICVLGLAPVLGGCGQEDAGETAGSESSENSVSVSAEAESSEIITADTILQNSKYDATQYVILMDDYMNLTVELESDYEVTDADIQEYIENNVLSVYPMMVSTDKTTVEDGDIANIEYSGTVAGEAFDGGAAEGYNLTIGSGTFIDGFEDGLIGAAVGNTVELELTFPEDYTSEDLAGQDVVFTVTVNYIAEEQTLSYDEITDEYVESVLGDSYSSVDEMLEGARSYLESYNAYQKNYDLQDAVLEMLLSGCTVNLPEGMLEEKVDSVIADIKEDAESANMTYEEYIEENYSYMAETTDDFEAYLSDEWESSMNQDMILEAIVAEQQISISSDEFEEWVNAWVEYYGFESTEDFYDTYGDEDTMLLNYAKNQALAAVMDGAATTVAAETDEVE